MAEALPLVTLGMPVYNGESYLEAALRGLQAQTWPHLEILISDNASTDGTEALCRRFAAEDPRIRYLRQPENIGAARNFDFLAHAARGEFFAWCAHDDLRLPDFVAACAAELLHRPEAVLCNSAVVFFDEVGQPRPEWPDLNFETRATTRPERAQRLVDHMHWVDMYGLIRRDALLRALPIEHVWGGDVVISMKLLMLGEFAKVDAPLFQYRVRTRPKSPEQMMWEFAQRDGAIPQPFTEMLQALLRVPIQAATDRAERAELMVRFLRAIVDLQRRDPHPCWRDVLVEEHLAEIGPHLRWETFPRKVLQWLAPALPGTHEEQDAEAVSLVIAGARRALVAVDGSPRRIRRARAALRALEERLPGVEWALLCPESWTAHRDSIPPAVTLLPYAPRSNGAPIWRSTSRRVAAVSSTCSRRDRARCSASLANATASRSGRCADCACASATTAIAAGPVSRAVACWRRSTGSGDARRHFLRMYSSSAALGWPSVSRPLSRWYSWIDSLVFGPMAPSAAVVR
jgi:hypothetical protein